jgi:methyl coenzyme M reductase gamma subunit
MLGPEDEREGPRGPSLEIRLLVTQRFGGIDPGSLAGRKVVSNEAK